MKYPFVLAKNISFFVDKIAFFRRKSQRLYVFRIISIYETYLLTVLFFSVTKIFPPDKGSDILLALKLTKRENKTSQHLLIKSV